MAIPHYAYLVFKMPGPCGVISIRGDVKRAFDCDRESCETVDRLMLAIIKCIYLPPVYLYSIQDIEDRCLLLMSSMSFVDLPIQEHRMTEKHHIDKNPYIS
jgi:hypothetical protein